MVDMAVFGDVAAARDGLTAMPVNTGEDFYKTNALTSLVIPSDKILRAMAGVTSTIANITQSRVHLTHEADWMDLGTGYIRDDAGVFPVDYPMIASKKLPATKLLAAELGNTNNSQVDNIMVFLANSIKDKLQFGTVGALALPEGYSPFRFSGAKTLVAGVLTDVTALTAITFNPDDAGIYHIGGATGWDATGGAARLKHREGGTQNVRPGFFVGDDAVPSLTLPTFQDFGSFKGDQYPVVQHLSMTAASAEEYIFWIKKTK